MKAVLDTMLWVSYCTRQRGTRHRLIEQAFRGRVRMFVSDYILDELTDVLRQELNESARYSYLARRAVLAPCEASRAARPNPTVCAGRSERRRDCTNGDFIEVTFSGNGRPHTLGTQEGP